MIEQHYYLVCSCLDRIRDCNGRLVQCDCPSRKPKMPVVIQDGCDYCIQQAAVRAAALAVISDPALRKALRAEDVAEETERLPMAVPDDLPLPEPESLCTDPTPASGHNLPVPAVTRRQSPQ